jgi:hypothetical protein
MMPVGIRTFPNGYLPVNAFGAVFLDVNLPGSASLAAYNYGDDPLGLNPGRWIHVPALPAPGQGNFSFVGIIPDQGLFGGMFIDFGGLRPEGEDPIHDMVALDDLILGQAPPIPEPSSRLLAVVGGVLAWATRYHLRRRG